MSAVSEVVPFEDSRRLTGANLFFDAPAAVLESTPAAADGVAEAWREHLATARAALGWPDDPVAVRAHAEGVSLALAAPLDQLYAATEVNEWALRAALARCGQDAGPAPHAPGDPAPWDEAEALATLAAMARAEARPPLRALAEAAATRRINLLVDDEQATLGSGRHGKTWPIEAVPEPAAIDWDARSDVPMALVTGSNGKTTVTRLLSAMGQGQGWRVAHSCTDGVFVDGQAIDRDDYSGPGGARLALRRSDIDAAILETARGGLMRRGIAPQRVDVAAVTNVSKDHFGEYGINNLDDLAEAKLTVARPLGSTGTLVLNADDARVLRHGARHPAPQALFALDADHPALQARRAQGGTTAGVRAGQLLLERGDHSLDLGAVAAMPLTFGGVAGYNIANIAAAVLVADALGIAPDAMRQALAHFGSQHGDNPGRLEHHRLGDLDAFLDYAHNPDGMRGLVKAATRKRPGRVGLILGQAGDRSDDDIQALTAAAAAARPDYVILKDIAGYQRGREPGEVPAIMRPALLQTGLDAHQIDTAPDEWQATRQLLAWTRPGDTLILQVLDKHDRARVSTLLQELAESGWKTGQPLPDDTTPSG